jgi:hypothetical protein
VVNIFARTITDDLASLVKQIDETVAKNDDKKMAAFVVLLSDDEAAAETQLKELAEKHEITNIPLTVFKDTKGPGNYKIAADADVTVMMWVGLSVKSNHAFAAGKLNKDNAAAVVADTAKILE